MASIALVFPISPTGSRADNSRHRLDVLRRLLLPGSAHPGALYRDGWPYSLVFFCQLHVAGAGLARIDDGIAFTSAMRI